eukprot:g34883.t1
MLRGDLIEVYEIMRGIDRVNSSCLFPRMGDFKSRGHIFKLRGARFKKDMKGRFFTQWMVRMWNELREEVGFAINTDSVSHGLPDSPAVRGVHLKNSPSLKVRRGELSSSK